MAKDTTPGPAAAPKPDPAPPPAGKPPLMAAPTNPLPAPAPKPRKARVTVAESHVGAIDVDVTEPVVEPLVEPPPLSAEGVSPAERSAHQAKVDAYRAAVAARSAPDAAEQRWKAAAIRAAKDARGIVEFGGPVTVEFLD